MTKKEYVKGKEKAGHIMHRHGGVWWETTRNGFCKPAVIFDEVEPGEARPALAKSYIGFNRRISDARKASGYWQPFLLTGKDFDNWSLDNLESGNRRRRIRKGLKNNEVRKLDNLAKYRSEFSRVLSSTAIRNGHGHPPEYYDESKTEWWELIQQVSHYTEFWGAFQDGVLAAYICLHVVGNRAVVDGVKSDTDMLPGCPIDAIVYNMITDLQKRGEVNEMWYGGKSNRPSLDKFKESYGFQVVQVPYQMYLLGGFIKYPRFLDKHRNKGIE